MSKLKAEKRCSAKKKVAKKKPTDTLLTLFTSFSKAQGRIEAQLKTLITQTNKIETGFETYKSNHLEHHQKRERLYLKLYGIMFVGICIVQAALPSILPAIGTAFSRLLKIL